MKQESGRSMIEMLGVLAIMGVITAGAIGMISTAMRTQKHSQVESDVAQIVSQVRTQQAGWDDFSHVNGSSILGAIGMSAKNPYGGVYEVSVNPSNTRQFIISINGLGQEDCQYLIDKPWTMSVGYQTSGHQKSGATGNCKMGEGKNFVQIIFSE